MYCIRFIQFDCLRTIETINKDKANQEYKELCSDPSVTELEALILTIDVRFSSSNKSYTYFVDSPLNNYRFVKTSEGDLLQIIGCKYRTPQELKALAKSQGFSYSQYKVLHGTAIR